MISHCAVRLRPVRSRLAGILCLLALAAGCAHDPTARELAATQMPSLPAPYANVVDGRAEFRAAFCARLAAAAAQGAATLDCDGLLWRLGDEPPLKVDVAPGGPLQDYQVIVVTGALGDCKWKGMLPFEPALQGLTAAGITVHPIVVGGRSSSAHNAQQIAAAVRALDPARPIIAVGYSKGTVDLLEFLVAEPALAQRVAAVVSVGGPVLGSPLAEEAQWWYAKLPQDAFASFCEPGDGGVFTSLLPATRRQWLEEHALPAGVRYFSIAAFTSREFLSEGLVLSWRKLGKTDQRNDGQVALRDALIPGSTLLALANADHWDLALALEGQVPVLSQRRTPRHFPRDILFEAALDVVARALGPRVAQQMPAHPQPEAVSP